MFIKRFVLAGKVHTMVCYQRTYIRTHPIFEQHGSVLWPVAAWVLHMKSNNIHVGTCEIILPL